jgi:hypothetical protein
LNYNRQALLIYKSQIAKVKAAANSVASEYRGVYSQTQGIYNELNGLKDKELDAEKQKLVLQRFRTLTGRDASSCGSGREGERAKAPSVDARALASAPAAAADYRDAAGSSAEALIAKAIAWRGAMRGGDFNPGSVNVAETTKAEEAAWAKISPLQRKSGRPQLSDGEGPAPGNLYAAFLRGGKDGEIANDAMGMTSDPQNAAGMTQDLDAGVRDADHTMNNFAGQ